MRIQQIILVICGIGLVTVLFLFGETRAPETESELSSAVDGNESGSGPAVDFTIVLQKAKETLTDPQRDSIEAMELQLQKVRGEKEKKLMLQSIGEKWTRTGNIIVAGKYFADAADVDNDKKIREEAAVRFYQGFASTSDSSAKIYGAREAIRAYQQLYRTDTTNLDYLVAEAVSYIEGLGQVMQGVTILKQVEKRDSNHKNMNLILGRLSIVSGQYDKAVIRLEKLVMLDPANAEAYFHLGEAYRALGRKEDAIKALERCKSLVTDADFNARIDSYINQIKNS